VQSSTWSEWLAAQEARLGAQLRQTRDFVLTNAGIRPGETVLDLGAGRGLLALAAAERVGVDGHVIAVDLDLGCLTALREAALTTTSGPQIRAVQTDATALPLADASVDVVATRSVLESYPIDPPRCTRPIACSEWADESPASRLSTAISPRTII